MKESGRITNELRRLLSAWEPVLAGLPEDVITQRRNSQNRSVKQILGHLIDSASNNNHRIVHLQYQLTPFQTMLHLVITTGGSLFRTTRMKTGR